MASEQPVSPRPGPPRPLTEEAFRDLYRRLRERAGESGAGRRGGLDRLTPERIVGAAAELRSARTVSLAAPG
ncbi:cyclase family protein, partial [Streptomyces sp. NPDC127079]